jgi:hypothetical protein
VIVTSSQILYISHIVSWNSIRETCFVNKNYHHFVKLRKNVNKSCTSWEVMKFCSLQLLDLTTFYYFKKVLLLQRHSVGWHKVLASMKYLCWWVPYVIRQHCVICDAASERGRRMCKNEDVIVLAPCLDGYISVAFMLTLVTVSRSLAPSRMIFLFFKENLLI